MSLIQFSRLLPLPEEELKQVLDYAATLSKPEAVDHFRNLLGDSPEAIDFISSFNARRKDPTTNKAPAAPTSSSSSRNASTHRAESSAPEPVPKPNRGNKKKRPDLHMPAPRRAIDSGPLPGTAYSKKNLGNDYVARQPSPAALPPVASSSVKTTLQQRSATTSPAPRSAPSGQGRLISDLPPPKTKPKADSGSSTPRSSTPATKTKVVISGGTAMHGASTALADLEDAIRSLEMTTNPAQAPDTATRRCNCVAARHPLQSAAPNCLNCGKVVCLKEGLGPCTFCGTPILSSSDVQSIIRELRDERGREKMALDRQAHKKAEVSKKPAPFTKPSEGPSEAELKALEHRDRLLGFQAQNARRTTVRDEATDFDVSAALNGTGGNIWASPEERARELRRQQKVLREMEWNARPEYEKRREVVSIDIVKGKAVRKMVAVERPPSPDEYETTTMSRNDSDNALKETSANRPGGGGAFSHNPLLGGLIKPVFDAKGKGVELEGRKANAVKWRRVQDDLDDNEAVILDGGIYGHAGASQSS